MELLITVKINNKFLRSKTKVERYDFWGGGGLHFKSNDIFVATEKIAALLITVYIIF